MCPKLVYHLSSGPKITPTNIQFVATSSSAHLFAIRGRQKRGPGTLQTRDQNLPKLRAYFFRINYGVRGRQH